MRCRYREHVPKCRSTRRFSRLTPQKFAHLFLVALGTSPGSTSSGAITTPMATSPTAASSFCVADFLRKNRARTIVSRIAYGRDENTLHRNNPTDGLVVVVVALHRRLNVFLRPTEFAARHAHVKRILLTGTGARERTETVWRGSRESTLSLLHLFLISIFFSLFLIRLLCCSDIAVTRRYMMLQCSFSLDRGAICVRIDNVTRAVLNLDIKSMMREYRV